MREITSHKANGLNEAIKIHAVDQPGAGGANHIYEIHGAGAAVRVEFQNGPVKTSGYNGISNEALLAVVVDRLEGFQRGPFACADNGVALTLAKNCLIVLHKRTTKRVTQGVEGTLVQHSEISDIRAGTLSGSGQAGGDAAAESVTAGSPLHGNQLGGTASGAPPAE